MKTKIKFVCNECGYESLKWLGKCPSCNTWNSFVEETEKVGGKFDLAKPSAIPSSKPLTLSEISETQGERIATGTAELDRVLGGGIVRGSMVLVGGDPGIGKSTLTLQTVMRLQDLKVLYVSGEESARQIMMRAQRLATANGSNQLSDNLLILCETSLEKIYEQIKAVQPQLLVIDSIQTISSEYVDSSAGSITQVRECAASLLKFAKESGTPVLLIGHITKDGSIAGPKILEHIVDAVLQFEGDQHYLYRILRPIKNRFGSTAELGIYEMLETGLRQVSTPASCCLPTVIRA